MKISYYDLLGLVKENKAPKKVKYDGTTFFYSDNNYYTADSMRELFCQVYDKLNDEVEIIEEEKEVELTPIEEFNISYNLGFIDYKNIEVLKNHLNKDFQVIFDTLDLLILNQKELCKVVNKLKKGK